MANEDEPSPSQPALVVARRRRGEDEAAPTSKKGLLLVVLLVSGAAAIVALAMSGMTSNGLYSRKIDQLVAQRSSFVGRQVIAEGQLVHGTLAKRESPCEYRFTLQNKGVEMPVRFAGCVVPDTFRDMPDMDVEVTVHGALQNDGSFEARKIEAKCPSKYEMKDRAKKGELAPHAQNAPGL
jgi:cytochrome c-type biogenesis protein CcmE